MIASEDRQPWFGLPDIHPYRFRRTEDLAEHIAQRRVECDPVGLIRH